MRFKHRSVAWRFSGSLARFSCLSAVFLTRVTSSRLRSLVKEVWVNC